MARFCANCGTEVDETAVFCPTCGQAIDQAAGAEMPAAPAWPEPEAPVARQRVAEPEQPDPVTDTGWAAAAAATEQPEEVTRVSERPADAPSPSTERSTPPPPAGDRGTTDSPTVNLPFTTPVTLSAWLIGGGAAFGALGVLISLFDGFLNPVELILLVALLGIAASVFLASNMPDIPNLRLATLAVVLVGFGVALDRIGFGGAGVGELLLFLGTGAAAIGAILLELGRDQPMGGPA